MSITRRFIFSVGANVGRAAASLIVGLLVARGLGPADYGNLAYLLGSFWAIRALLDLGTSSAFYTFIAQRHRGRSYYLIYFSWLGIQFVLSIALVAVLLPQSVVERFWLGQERGLILLALIATYLQNQVWQTVVQTHEALRKTVRVQLAGLLIIVAHLLLVVFMLAGDWLSIQAVLWAIIAEYLVASAWLSWTLKAFNSPDNASAVQENPSVPEVMKAYLRYCRPMVVIAVFAFVYEMTDRWLLQRFGGASQQGFYQAASQLSTISLLAATSILNIFWKEIAEACDRKDHLRVITLHQKTTRYLVLLAATVACFLAPWAEELIDVLLGHAYHAAWPALFLMLFYPVHQTMGQINGTLFMATGKNSAYMKITIAGLVASLPVSYMLIAPEDGVMVSGLELGAMGLAIKIVGLNILFVNFQSWVIARHYEVKFHWHYQLSILLALLILGYGCRLALQGIIPFVADSLGGATKFAVLITMGFAGILYLIGVFGLLVRVPKVLGLDYGDAAVLLEKIRSLAR